MYPFRELTPQRRKDRAVCVSYRSYKDTLKEDFNDRCGYCDDTDGFRFRDFAIDHFVPRNPVDFEHDIPENEYTNLVYSCDFCNSAKSNKWYTVDANIHHENNVGFLDPTSDEYTQVFRRDSEGRIVGNGVNDALAEHIINELDLFLALHRIVWKLERLNVYRAQIETELANSDDQNLNDSLKRRLTEVMQEFGALSLNLFVEING